jgi:hypothetical protein
LAFLSSNGTTRGEVSDEESATLCCCFRFWSKKKKASRNFLLSQIARSVDAISAPHVLQLAKAEQGSKRSLFPSFPFLSQSLANSGRRGSRSFIDFTPLLTPAIVFAGARFAPRFGEEEKSQ